MTESEYTILPKTIFKGRLKDGTEAIKVNLTAWAGDEGRLQIRIDSPSKEVYFFCAHRVGKVGQTSPEFSLLATSSNGKRLESNEISVSRHMHVRDGFEVDISARKILLVVPLDEYVEKPYQRFWFRGFKSFRGHEATTPFGRVVIKGDAKNVGADDVTGFVALQWDNGCLPENWQKDGENLLRHMQMGFEFAHGGRLQVPMKDICLNSEHRRAFYNGHGVSAELAVIHHLDQQAFFDALVGRFLTKGQLSDPFWSAVGWLRVETTYDELRFLTAMTSLETLVSLSLPDVDTILISKPKFAPIKEALKAVIDNEMCLANKTKKIFKSSVSGINRRPLAVKMEALFDHYEISRQDFGKSVLKEMIDHRNDLVHRGEVGTDVDLWRFIILARELVTRIVLSEIGFKGRYQCYIGSRDWREFP